MQILTTKERNVYILNKVLPPNIHNLCVCVCVQYHFWKNQYLMIISIHNAKRVEDESLKREEEFRQSHFEKRYSKFLSRSLGRAQCLDIAVRICAF